MFPAGHRRTTEVPQPRLGGIFQLHRQITVLSCMESHPGVLQAEAWCPAGHGFHHQSEGENAIAAHVPWKTAGKGHQRSTHLDREDVPTCSHHQTARPYFATFHGGGTRFQTTVRRWDPRCHPRAQEEIWRRTFSVTCSSMSHYLFSLRYVDNRLWISERRFEQLLGVKLFLNSKFFGGDITSIRFRGIFPQPA